MARPMMSKERNVAAYVASLPPAQRSLVNRLRRIVKRQAPHLREVMKWGNVCWVGEGNVCLIHVAADHLDFAFFLGARLDDPEGVLTGKGKYLRMVKVRKATDIHPQQLARLVDRAVALDRGRPGNV